MVDQNTDGARTVADRVGGISVTCDVGNEESVNAMVRSVEEQLGPVDVCLSNAGIYELGGTPLDAPPEVWNRQWSVNVMAHVYVTRAVLPSMLERGTGYILFTSSIAGILTNPDNAVYSTTKHAVVGFAEWMSIAYHNRGIRVSLLAPLLVRTPMVDTSSPLLSLLAPLVKEPTQVADVVVEAIGEERFLILTDEVSKGWIEGKANNLEGWLEGMRSQYDAIR